MADRARLAELVSSCLALGAATFGGPLSPAEQRLVASAADVAPDTDRLRAAILAGEDPLGEAIGQLRSPLQRRRLGAFYTPRSIVATMIDWALDRDPERVVDPGCGSGRFAAEAVRRSPALQVVAVDVDPLATLACRATLATLGAGDARVVNADFVRLELEPTCGRTVFVGNPPYIRHHSLSPQQKAWARRLAAEFGIALSGLAGTHVHFFFAAWRQASRGDAGCFITSAEWLDVAYGEALRKALLDDLGVVGIYLLDRQEATFAEAMTTAVITCFEVGAHPTTIQVRSLKSSEALGSLATGGRAIPRSELQQASRWTSLVCDRPRSRSPHLVRLGEFVRVSRGAVTGANNYFVLDPTTAARLGLTPYVLPVLSSAQEVLRAGGIVRWEETRRVLLQPVKGIEVDAEEHRALKRYLAAGERLGVPNGYICRHRNPWWYVGAKAPPIVATYMARQPPAFALNPDRLAILNVFHGLYPRIPLDDRQLLGLVRYLNAHRLELRGAGRTYQGGLEKFEPGEMEALEVPPPERLRAYADP